jgi:hypothetical protein
MMYPFFHQAYPRGTNNPRNTLKSASDLGPIITSGKVTISRKGLDAPGR